MNNPFKLLTLMFKARRPSRIGVMRAVRDGFWLGKGYEAMMFFGHIITHSQHEADAMNSHPERMNSVQRHETIHLRQAQACHDSWLCYYWLYGWYYLRGLTLLWHQRKTPRRQRVKNAPYRLNPFEIEAYDYMYDVDYLENHCQQAGARRWRVYARMTPRQRLKRLIQAK